MSAHYRRLMWPYKRLGAVRRSYLVQGDPEASLSPPDLLFISLPSHENIHVKERNARIDNTQGRMLKKSLNKLLH